MKINGKPDGGGGGGVITGLSISANGIYIAEGGVDGYSPVEVSVPEQKPEETFSVTPSIAAQTVTPQEGYVFSGGTVAAVTSTIDGNIQSGNIKSGVTILGVEGTYTAPAPVTESLSVSVNGTYYPGQGVDGFSEVVVDVPQSVTGFTEKDVTEGLSITVLSNSASYVHSYVFDKDTNLREINLPNCLEVNEYAFANCGSLNTINLPVCSRIESFAFEHCNNISYISVPKCEDVGGYAFQYCNYLYSISLPECTYLGMGCFQYCYWLSSVSLPKCRIIRQNAFMYCTRLQSIYAPECIEVQGTAFGNISSAFSLSLPIVSKFGNVTFQNCSQFSELTLCTETYTIPSYTNVFQNTPFNQGNGSIYVDAALYDKFITSTGWSSLSAQFVSVGNTDPMLSVSDGLLYGKTTNIYQYWSNYVGVASTTVTKVSLSQCKWISTNAFYGCSNLSEVSLPNCSLLLSSAFMNCFSLTSVYMPEIKYIGYKAFYQCNALSEIDLYSCEYIDGGAFNWLQALSKVTFRGSTVCELYDSNVFSQYSFQTPLVSFFVPASLVDAYKADSNWSWYSRRIFPIPE